jgi:glycosyltransferase involved in cell wall biosynthesis
MDRAAACTTWSSWAARSLVRDYGVPEDRVSVVYPGVSLSAAPARGGHSSARPRILFVGADLERKGGDLLIDVYRRSLVGRCELDIVTTAAIPDGDGVHVHRGVRPNSPELKQLYASADVFVLPTRGDCLALVIGEAMAAGLPVITTRGAGHSESVEDGESGFLIEINDPDALVARLDMLIADPHLRLRMGERGRAIAAARLDVRHTANALSAMLKRLADGTDGAAATRAVRGAYDAGEQPAAAGVPVPPETPLAEASIRT